MKQILILSFLLLYALKITGQSIDSQASRVEFEIRNMKIKTVDGSFLGMQGTVEFDTTNLDVSRFEVCIDASTVNTGKKKRDAHLRNEDYFHVEKYPTICFSSQSISAGENGFLTHGTLTMHGVTRHVEIPFNFSDNTFTGTLNLNRLDYNVGEGTGTFMVGNEVSVRIICRIQ
jgi:polyisoprenoid-binding protein YceI